MTTFADDKDVSERRAAYSIETGRRYRFAYPEQFVSLTDYSAHRGQEVEVLRELEEHEVDIENAPMYRVRANDGWEGEAWPDELQPLETQ